MRNFLPLALVTVTLAGCAMPKQTLLPHGLSPSFKSGSATTTIVPSKQRASVPMPKVGSYSGSILVPRGTGAPIRVDVTLGLPAGAPALPPGNSAMIAVRFTGTGQAQLARLPGFALIVPRRLHLGNKNVFAAAYANNGWVTLEGPANVDGRNATLAPVPPAMKLLAGHWVQLVIYSGRRL